MQNIRNQSEDGGAFPTSPLQIQKVSNQLLDDVRLVTISEAKNLIEKFHYSKVMPRITKYCIGGFWGKNLVAVATLGWGTRPQHTINVAFPSLTINDYFELGKLCVDDQCPRNTESYFISQMLRWCKRNLHIKILYSWADGIIGKPGYVYQASNFYYGGFIWTTMYLSADGNRVHPRSMQQLNKLNSETKYGSRATHIVRELGFTKYYGLQFRYVYPLCNEMEWEMIYKKSPFQWKRKEYPKDSDCKWKIQIEKGKLKFCEKPNFISTKSILH